MKHGGETNYRYAQSLSEVCDKCANLHHRYKRCRWSSKKVNTLQCTCDKFRKAIEA